MAGVNFEKYKTSQKVKSVLRHCDKAERQKAEHSNDDINLNMTGRNVQTKRDYKSTCERFDERMEWLEQQPNKNKRSDKVICLGLEIPAPKDLSEKDFIPWLKDVYAIVGQQYGKENILNVYGHVDEQHEYYNAETKQKTVSRRHIHIPVIPEIDGRLNARDACNRSSMIKLNNAIHEMSLDKYGVEFMDGSKSKSKNSIQALKRRSELIADIKALEEQKQALQDEITDIMTKRHKYAKGEKHGKKISQVIMETQERLAETQRENEMALIRRAKERSRRAYDIIKPEGYDSYEEQSDEELS